MGDNGPFRVGAMRHGGKQQAVHPATTRDDPRRMGPEDLAEAIERGRPRQPSGHT